MRNFVVLVLILCCSRPTPAQENQENSLTVVFYNVENLFDTFDDPETEDTEFTPIGQNHWTKSRLERKLISLFQALLSAGKGHYPDIIGLAEVENMRVIEFLLGKTQLGQANYGIIHKESPDLRGIDVALLYRKEQIHPIDFSHIPVRGDQETPVITRDILWFKGAYKNQPIHFLVNHWPSRSGGYTETREKRGFAALELRHFLDSLQNREPDIPILLMGDFNSTPKEKCLTGILKATTEISSPTPLQLVNLSQSWIKSGKGTIRSAGNWEIFDQFICTGNLLIPEGNLMINLSKTRICDEPFLLEKDERYLGKKPFRTFLGPAYHGGISDHLPIVTEISSNKESR